VSRDIEDITCGPRSVARGTIVKSSKQGIDWERAYYLGDLLALLERREKAAKVRLVVGNTSTGVYPTNYDCNLVIDISRVHELLKCIANDNKIIIGGAVSISDFMKLLWENKDLSPTYSPIFRHLKRVSKNI
jgi:xanthine dehydrogenase iron-sulfur cluster and FAD-binding subunit A